MEKLTAVLIVTVMVMSGINSVTLLIATVGNSGSVPVFRFGRVTT